MKHKLIPVLFTLSTFFLFSCSPASSFVNDGNQIISTQEAETTPTEPMAAETKEETPERAPITGARMDANSACYHPYFPVNDNASWTYAYASGEGYTLSIDETGEDSFTMRQVMDNEDTVFTVDWFCNDNGLLSGAFAQVDILNQATGAEGAEFVFETQAWEGETLPAPELMQVGYTWTTAYQISGEINLAGVSGTVEALATISNEIGAVEAVTVPAGTFSEAYRVDSVGEIEMVMEMFGTSTPISGIDFPYSTWYVEGVGMVRSSDTFTGIATLVELTDSSFLD